MMRATLKAIAWIAGAAVVAVALVLVFFPEERIRDLAVARLSEALERPVRVGDVSLGLIGGLRLRLEDLGVGESAAPGAPLVRVASVALELALPPLLRGNLVVRGIDIERPELEIVLADEAAGAGAGADEPRSAAREGALPLAIVVESLRIEEGRIDVRDAKGAPVAEIEGFSEELRAALSPEQQTIQLEGRSSIEKLVLHTPAGRLGQGLRLELSKELRYETGEDRLHIDEARLRLGGLPVALHGVVSRLGSGQPGVELLFEGGPAQLDEIFAFLPAELFPITPDARSRGSVRLQGRVSAAGGVGNEGIEAGAAELDYDLRLLLEQGRVAYGEQGAAIEEIEIRAHLTPERFDLERFGARAAGSRLSVRAEIENPTAEARLAATIDAELELGELARLHPAAEALRLEGGASAELAIGGPIADPMGLEIEGALELRSVWLSEPSLPGPIRDLDARLRLTPERLWIDELDFAILASDLALSGVLDRPLALAGLDEESARAQFDARLRSHTLDLDQLFPPDPTAPKGFEPLPPLDGRLALKIDRLVSNEIEMRQLAASAELDSGRIRIVAADLLAFGGSVQATGEVDLSDPEAPRYDLETTLEGVRAQELVRSSPAFEGFGGLAGGLGGSCDAEVRARGAFDDTLGIELSSLSASGALAFDALAIEGLPAQAELAKLLATPDLATLRATDLRQTIRIDDGSLALDDLKIEAAGITLTGGGAVSLEGVLDFALDVRLPASALAAIQKRLPAPLAALAGGGGSVPIPIRIAGPALTPRVSFDDRRVADAAAQAARIRLATEQAELKERAEQEARELSRGLIEELGDPGQDDSSSVAEQVTREVEELKEKGLEGLKGLFGGKKKRKK